MNIGPYELIVFAAWWAPIPFVIWLARRKGLNGIGITIAAVLAWPVTLFVVALSREQRR